MNKCVSRSCKMMVKMQLWILTLSNILQMCNGVSVTIKLPGNFTAPPIVSVLEGNNITLSCITEETLVSILWSKQGDTDFSREGGQLYIGRVRLQHGGEYTCAILDQNGNEKANSKVEVNVLYPPGRVDISGPTSAVKGDIFNLTCHAASNPEASYLWSYSASGAPIVHRGPTFPDIKYPDTFNTVYCFAETTLVPTQGESLRTTVNSEMKVIEHVRASIHDLQGTVSLEEDMPLDVYCRASGVPTPAIYWSKDGSNVSINSGERFVVPNVGLDSDGAYRCFAENVVTDATGNDSWGFDARTMFLRVVKKVTGESSAETCSHGILAALAIGWMCVLVLLLIGLFYYIRVREVENSPSWNKHHPSEAQTAERVNMASASNNDNARPVLPKRPVEREESRHSYLSLQQATIDHGNAKCLTLSPPESYTYTVANSAVQDPTPPFQGGVRSGTSHLATNDIFGKESPDDRAASPTPHVQASNDGYLTPQSKLGESGAYVEPYSTSQEAKPRPHPTEKTDSAESSNDQYESI